VHDFAANSLHTPTGRGFVRAEFILAPLRRRLPEHPGHYGDMVWIPLMLEQWLQARERPRHGAP